jgi:DNA-binding response OmpR family regulator
VVTPILVVSAHTAAGQVELCLAAGADDHIGKPYSLSRLLARLHADLDPAASSRLRPGVARARAVRLQTAP